MKIIYQKIRPLLLPKCKMENFAQNDHQHHKRPHSILPHHVNNPRPVSTSLGFIRRMKKHSIINMLKKDKFAIGCKKKMQYKTIIATQCKYYHNDEPLAAKLAIVKHKIQCFNDMWASKLKFA